MNYFAYIKTFVTVHRCGSYGKASNILSLTQPAISKQIASLENQIGKELFYRSGPRRYQPTIVGDTLACELAPHVDQIEYIFNASRVRGNKQKSILYIGGLIECFEHQFSKQIALLMKNDIEINVVDSQSNRCWKQLLEDNLLDIAFLPNPYSSAAVESKWLSSCEIQAVCHTELLKQHQKLPVILHTMQVSDIANYVGYLSSAGVHARKSASFNNFDLIYRLVKQGAGVGLLPTYYMRSSDLESGEFVALRGQASLKPLNIYLAWNKLSMHSPVKKKALEAILRSSS